MTALAGWLGNLGLQYSSAPNQALLEPPPKLLTGPQEKMLAVCYASGPITVTKLSELYGCSGSFASERSTELVRAKFLRRVSTQFSNTVRLELTDKGRRYVEQQNSNA